MQSPTSFEHQASEPLIKKRILPKFIADPIDEHMDDAEESIIDRMQCALMALQEENNERDAAREDGLFERGADFEEQFELDGSSATLNVTSDEIFQFIWDFVMETEILRMVGNPQIMVRKEVEYFLTSDIEAILHLLEVALCTAIAICVAEGPAAMDD